MGAGRNLHLVFSTPPPEIRDEMYNAWYDFHVYEILRTPGYDAVRRYEITPRAGTREPATKRFVSVYAIGDDLDRAAEDLAAERDNMDLPRWFGGIRFASWVAELSPGYDAAVLGDRLSFVFSGEPAEVAADWRFGVTASTRPDGAPPMKHLALARQPGPVPDRDDITAVEGRAIGDRIESA